MTSFCCSIAVAWLCGFQLIFEEYYDEGKKCHCTLHCQIRICVLEMHRGKAETWPLQPLDSSIGSFLPGTGWLDQHRSGKACLWHCWWPQAAASCHFFLKLIKGVIWTSLQFLIVCRKDQSRNVKQADAAAYSSCNLVRAVRGDSRSGDRFALSFPFYFGCAVGLLIETSVLLHSE